jgi:Secretion system C-terminal sorting domain
MKKFILLILVCFAVQLFGQVNVEWEALPPQSGSEARILHQSKQGFFLASFPLAKKTMLSKDGAKTWTEVTFEETPLGYSRFVNDESEGIYCFSQNKIFKLDITKNIFKKILTLDTLNWVQDMAFGHDKLYVAASTQLQIYNFSDLSLIFSKKWLGNTSKLILGPNNKNYAKTNHGGNTYYWNSFDDDGANFKEYGKKTEIGEYYNSIFALNSGSLILVYDSNLHTSIDNGVTWSKQNKFTSVRGLFVDSKNELFILDNDKLYTSVNEGDTWKNIPHPLKKANFLTFWKNNPNQIVIKSDDCNLPKLFFTQDKGQSWVSESLSLDQPLSYQIKITPDKDIMTRHCSFFDKINLQNNAIWKSVAIHDSIPVGWIHFLPSGKWITYNYMNRSYFITKDKGITWTLYDKLPKSNEPFRDSGSLSYNQDGDLLYYDSEKYYISKDEGENWNIINAIPELDGLSAYDEILMLNGYFIFTANLFSNSLNIYNPNTQVTTQVNKINGKSIDNPSQPKLLKKTKVCFIASILTSGYYIPYLYISSDLGTSFISKKLPVNRRSEVIDFIKSTNDNLILLTRDNVYISYDEGDTWNTIKGNLPSNIEYSALAISNDEYLYVGMKGAPIYKTKLSLPKTIKTDDAISEISDFRLSPNPVTDELNIQFADNQLDMSSISIYSIEGKLLQQSQFQGNNTAFNVKHFPVGMYILQLKNGDKIGVKRFVKQ